MARLANLGMPFGSPGGIINLPAPAGAALAGQIQMQNLEKLGQAFGLGLGRKEQGRLEDLDLQRMLSMGPQQDIFNTMYGARGMQPPQAQMPQMQSRKFREAQLQGLLGTIFRDPLEREYKQALIDLTKQRKIDLEDKEQRGINVANTLLRTVGFMLDELWYMEEGPEKEKHIKKIQQTRERAYKLIENYGASPAGEVATKQLANIDEEIRKAGLPIGKLEVNRMPPIAPRPYLNKYWSSLDDETKSLITKAIFRGAKQSDIIAALKTRGSIK